MSEADGHRIGVVAADYYLASLGFYTENVFFRIDPTEFHFAGTVARNAFSKSLCGCDVRILCDFRGTAGKDEQKGRHDGKQLFHVRDILLVINMQIYLKNVHRANFFE